MYTPSYWTWELVENLANTPTIGEKKCHQYRDEPCKFN